MKTAVKDKLIQVSINAENSREESLEYDLECIMSVLTQLSYHIDVFAVIDKVKQGYDLLLASRDYENISPVQTPGLMYTQKRGRPAFNIPEDTLIYFLENHFNIRQMSEILGVSKRTVSNKLNMYGLSIRGTYTSLDDNELMNRIRQKVSEFPSIGYRSIQGHLKAEGIRITEARVRKLMRAVDPLGVLMRNIHCQTCYKKTGILSKSTNGVMACRYQSQAYQVRYSKLEI